MQSCRNLGSLASERPEGIEGLQQFQPFAEQDSDYSPNHYHMNRDTSVPNVLVSKSFAYYGAAAIPIPIPEEFRHWEGQDYFASVRDYRRHFPDDLHIEFTSWLDSLADIGKAGEPLHHPNLTRPQRARSQCRSAHQTAVRPHRSGDC